MVHIHILGKVAGILLVAHPHPWPFRGCQSNDLSTNICRQGQSWSIISEWRGNPKVHREGITPRRGEYLCRCGGQQPLTGPPGGNRLSDWQETLGLHHSIPTIPITVLHGFWKCLHYGDAHQNTIADLLCVGLFCLCRPGYYCKGGTNTAYSACVGRDITARGSPTNDWHTSGSTIFNFTMDPVIFAPPTPPSLSSNDIPSCHSLPAIKRGVGRVNHSWHLWPPQCVRCLVCFLLCEVPPLPQHTLIHIHVIHKCGTSLAQRHQLCAHSDALRVLNHCGGEG